MKLGNISSVMSMIPGMSQMMPKGQEKEGANRIQVCGNQKTSKDIMQCCVGAAKLHGEADLGANLGAVF